MHHVIFQTRLTLSLSEDEVLHGSVSVFCRCIVQLTVIGYILAPIFSLDSWWLVILYATVMMGVASLEAVSRPAASHKVTGVS